MSQKRRLGRHHSTGWQLCISDFTIERRRGRLTCLDGCNDAGISGFTAIAAAKNRDRESRENLTSVSIHRTTFRRVSIDGTLEIAKSSSRRKGGAGQTKLAHVHGERGREPMTMAFV
jgi:hypothetical protein